VQVIKWIIVLLAFAIASGCATRITDFTLISSKNFSLDEIQNYERTSERVTGVHAEHVIVVIPTGRPDMKEALDRAIESDPAGVALTDGVVTFKSFYIPYIYGRSWYEVEGSLLIDPRLKN
jgi:hypothetical protein